MELVYTVCRKQPHSVKTQQNYEWVHEGMTLCSISSQNVVAFTTTTELVDTAGKSWGAHVYVADLNSPWDAHRVVSNVAEITSISWDLPGQKLLIADADGTVQIWTFKDHVINDWLLIGSASFPGERVTSSAFFHNGRKISLVAERKDSVLYGDKFSHLRFAQSVRHFGGRPVEGCIVISTTRMVGIVLIPPVPSEQPLQTVSEILGFTRQRISVVDICYAKNGDFLVATSGGSVSTAIQCYRVVVRCTDDGCSITSKALPSFFLQSANLRETNNYNQLTELRWVVREDADALVVVANGDSGGLVETWELREKPLPIHELFQASLPAGQTEPCKTVLWQHHTHFKASSPVISIATPKLCITTAVSPPCYIAVALGDGTIHCLFRDTLQQVASTTLTLPWTPNDIMMRPSRVCQCITSLDFTWIGNVLLAADSKGQLYLYRLLPVMEAGGPLTVPLAVTLLEFCLVTGLDWWDLLISLRPSMLDAVSERMTEGFNRQSPATQQFYFTRFLAIKTSLYRLTMSGQAKAADLNAFLMLHAVSAAFKSVLRPSDLSSHDKGPAENLSVILASKTVEGVLDVDKLLLHIEAKEFTVEPSTLQSMQQLIQWAADLALHLLSRIPEQRQVKGSGGYDLLRDPKALAVLRELLVIIRVWGLVRSSCLPVFVRSVDNLDVLATIFKLLSRLAQNSECDDILIDECCLLQSQIVIPQLCLAAPTLAVASPAFFFQSLPIQLEFGSEPPNLNFFPELNHSDVSGEMDHMVDSVRHIYLGIDPAVYKLCSRCGGKCQTRGLHRSAANRAWDLRWARSCRCGGHWRFKRSDT